MIALKLDWLTPYAFATVSITMCRSRGAPAEILAATAAVLSSLPSVRSMYMSGPGAWTVAAYGARLTTRSTPCGKPGKLVKMPSACSVRGTRIGVTALPGTAFGRIRSVIWTRISSPTAMSNVRDTSRLIKAPFGSLASASRSSCGTDPLKRPGLSAATLPNVIGSIAATVLRSVPTIAEPRPRAVIDTTPGT